MNEEQILDYIQDIRRCEKEMEMVSIKETKCCENLYMVQISDSYVCINCGVTSKDQVYDDDAYTFGNSEVYLPQVSSVLYSKSAIGTVMTGNSRLAKINAWGNMTYKDRVIWEVSNFLRSKLLSYPDKILQDTIYMYKKYYDNSQVKRGKNKQGLIATCLFFVLKENSMPMSPKQVCELMDVDIAVLNRCISIYMVEKLSITDEDPVHYLQVYFNKYNTEFKVQKLMKKILEVLYVKNFFYSSVPQSISTAVFIFVLEEMEFNIDPKEICGFANISLNTIRKMTNKLQENKQYIFINVK